MTEKTVEIEIVPPHASNFIRSVNTSINRQLKENEEASVEVPTLLTRAKTLVERKSYFARVNVYESQD